MSRIKSVKIRGPSGLPYIFPLTAKDGEIVQTYVWAFTTNIFNVATNLATNECISVLSVISRCTIGGTYFVEWLPLIWIDGNPRIIDLIPKCVPLLPPIHLNAEYDGDVIFVMPLQENAQVSATEYSGITFNVMTWPLNRSGVCREIPIVVDQRGTNYDWLCTLPRLHYVFNATKSQINVLSNVASLDTDINNQTHVEYAEGQRATEDVEEDGDKRKRSLSNDEDGADMASCSSVASGQMLKRSKEDQWIEVIVGVPQPIDT